MSDFLIAPVARTELDEIWEYYAIELQNPGAADRIRDEIFAAFHKLAQTPGMGHFRIDLAKEPLRFWHPRIRYGEKAVFPSERQEEYGLTRHYFSLLFQYFH
jgi:plasmid stabilization system protein ParE